MARDFLTNAFAGSPLDRAGDRRDDAAWLAEMEAHDAGACLAIWEGSPLLEDGPDGPRLAWLSPRMAAEAAGEPLAFLGLWKDAPVFAVKFREEADPTNGPLQGLGRFLDMRSSAAVLPAIEVAMAGTAKGLFDWHTRHGFCSACGKPTRPTCGGWKRVCDACTVEHFPRIDPVVIMLPIYSGGPEPRCLLGRQSAWPAKRMSALAGFMEPGESIEEACAREIAEESGLNVVSVRYHSSQPWPFPSQLMIGLFAEVDGEDARPDQTELEAVAWLTRAEARAVLAATHPDIAAPPPFAIAHTLLQAWSQD